MQSLMVLSSDAALESVSLFDQSHGKVFNLFPGNGAKNFSTIIHPLIAERVRLVLIKFICHNLVLKRLIRCRIKKMSF
jgi:hypothetical protein